VRFIAALHLTRSPNPDGFEGRLQLEARPLGAPRGQVNSLCRVFLQHFAPKGRFFITPDQSAFNRA
jgi:hypothetical protein